MGESKNLNRAIAIALLGLVLALLGTGIGNSGLFMLPALLGLIPLLRVADQQ